MIRFLAPNIEYKEAGIKDKKRRAKIASNRNPRICTEFLTYCTHIFVTGVMILWNINRTKQVRTNLWIRIPSVAAQARSGVRGMIWTVASRPTPALGKAPRGLGFRHYLHVTEQHGLTAPGLASTLDQASFVVLSDELPRRVVGIHLAVRSVNL